MRERLFRGKTVDAGWVEGFYVHLYNGRGDETHRIYASFAETDCGDYYPDWFEIDPSTIGQDTGLKDKNGKRIFEGDIVRLIESCPSCHDTEIVKFKDGGFAPFSIAGWECTPKWEECEVIGNIHDNPELLEIEHER